MKRQVCPNCGTVQPEERRYCVSCGERLDDNASEYIDSRLYFERKPWMNVVVAVLLALAVGNIVLTVVYGNTHYVWVPFICAVWFVFAAVVFAFPTVMYMVFGYIWHTSDLIIVVGIVRMSFCRRTLTTRTRRVSGGCLWCLRLCRSWRLWAVCGSCLMFRLSSSSLPPCRPSPSRQT